ncbi:MAG: PilZ domain-containing protein [Desulfobacterales bacterium]|jgi:hypothetical protein
METSNKEKKSEKRYEPRIDYSGSVFFSTKDAFYEGDLENYSENGLFIRTDHILPLGSVITIALPYLDGHVKRQGQVMRADKNGFGIELFKEDDEAFQSVTPREMAIK